MKTGTLAYLTCTRCGSQFHLEILQKINDEIEDGLLSCDCGNIFPAVKGIPRTIPTAFEDNPAFTTKYRDLLKTKVKNKNSSNIYFRKLYEKTKRSFGRQWTVYQVQNIEEDTAAFLAKTGFDPEEICHRLVMDAGCGGGRYTYIAARLGANVIAVDLSGAVEKTKELTGHFPNVEIVQANLFELPFRNEIFDYIYSIGVLHHTPDR